LTRSLNHFAMIYRRLFVCSALLLFGSVAYGAGSYQRTRDGKALVWNASPKNGEEATWSGKRDKKGFATGSGILTWYKVIPTFITGSLIPDTRRYVVVVNRYSGKMVHGKLKGAVTYIDANGKRSRTTFVNGRSVNRSPPNRPSRGKKAAPTPIPAVTATPTAEQTPTPAPEQSASPAAQEIPAVVTPHNHPSPGDKATPAAIPAVTARPTAEQTPTPAREQSPSSVAQEIPRAAQQTSTRRFEPQAGQPDAQRPQSHPMPTPPDYSPRPLVAAPSPLLKPPPTVDAETVAKFDTVYQEAVEANDVAIMDQILADDFVFITDRGASLTKADLLKEAREKRTIYENQKEEEGTQKVRIWRDTAVVTALLKIKGKRDQNPFDYEVWVNQIYVRTPTGWRYVFGRASIPLPKSDAK
jgi:ketosteroid isomerase-like protein